MAKPQRLATGGVVAAAIPTSGSSQIVNIMLSPTYMTGDRQSVRKVAEQLKVELDKLNLRRGN